MRLWIAAFLISLFAFQVLPATVWGKCCQKVKLSTGDAPGEDGADDESAAPENDKLKKSRPGVEAFDLRPPCEPLTAQVFPELRRTFSPETAVIAAHGHTRIHTPPPDAN